jgi:hypothetical protein
MRDENAKTRTTPLFGRATRAGWTRDYASIPADGSSIGIIEIARRTETTPSMAHHRYVSTLVVPGLVEREPNGGLPADVYGGACW